MLWWSSHQVVEKPNLKPEIQVYFSFRAKTLIDYIRLSYWRYLKQQVICTYKNWYGSNSYIKFKIVKKGFPKVQEGSRVLWKFNRVMEVSRRFNLGLFLKVLVNINVTHQRHFTLVYFFSVWIFSLYFSRFTAVGL